MSSLHFNVVLFLFFFFLFGGKHEHSDLTKSSILPIPRKVTASGSYFSFEEGYRIYGDDSAPVDHLKIQLEKSLSDLLKKKSDSGANELYLAIQQLPGIPDEGYQLDISKNKIEITGKDGAGIFYGIQTLIQLIHQNGTMIPTGEITDFPRYKYRGAMLDVARHFFQVEDVKSYIDYLSMYKINHLHLHLSDDQGWRIEIPEWEKLTSYGGSTEVGGGEGGFYTLEEYAEIVDYASDRFITIVPEIDMPGHTNAALASYPQLNCDGKARKLYTGIEVGFSTLCVDKEVTYTFVEDVVRTISEVTPGPYFHIGGDESHVTSDEDYVIFVNKVKDIVHKYGKTIIGWDEIAHADLEAGTIVQWWATPENALMGIKKSTKVLVSPASRVYLDMQYDSTTYLGLHWAGYTEIDSSYLWDPAKLVEGINDDHIIGVESPLWTETITNLEELEYMVFPRIIGHAEIGWSDPSNLSWESYSRRLIDHQKQLKFYNINFYKSPLVHWDP